MTADSAAVDLAADRANWKVYRAERWRDVEQLAATDIVVYGEHMFAEYVAQVHQLALLQPPFHFVASLPSAFRKRTIQFTDLRNARSWPETAFFKPADDKCFPAKVYKSGAELPGGDILPDATPVLISEPVEWELEFRCFVLDRQVATCSPYLRGGVLAQDEDGTWPADPSEIRAVTAWTSEVLSDGSVRVPPALVLDVGVIQGRGWAVVEANPAWAAGIYGCDPDTVLPVLARSCVRRDHVGPSDSPWVMNQSL
jgi:hypothetical protein